MGASSWKEEQELAAGSRSHGQEQELAPMGRSCGGLGIVGFAPQHALGDNRRPIRALRPRAGPPRCVLFLQSR